MAEKKEVFSSKIKYNGIFDFRDFYNFCYDWLIEETQLDFILEEKYEEKIEGNGKSVNVEWSGESKINDFFKFKMKIGLSVSGLQKVEVNKGGIKVNTNKGGVQIKVKGVLVRDYQGKFENNAFQIFLRNAYERWVIPEKIDQFEGEVFSDCDEFLSQAKAYLDLEGKR